MRPATYLAIDWSVMRVFVLLSVGVKELMEKCNIMTRYINYVLLSVAGQIITYNTQHSQQTDTHAAGGIRTHSLSRRETGDLRHRPRDHWEDRSLQMGSPAG